MCKLLAGGFTEALSVPSRRSKLNISIQLLNSKPSRGRTAASTGDLTDPTGFVLLCLCPGCCSCCRSCRSRARWRWLLETLKHVYFLGHPRHCRISRADGLDGDLRGLSRCKIACRVCIFERPYRCCIIRTLRFRSGFLEYCAVMSPFHKASGSSGAAADDRAMNVREGSGPTTTFLSTYL
jgi:hypothetical protein